MAKRRERISKKKKRAIIRQICCDTSETLRKMACDISEKIGKVAAIHRKEKFVVGKPHRGPTFTVVFKNGERCRFTT